MQAAREHGVDKVIYSSTSSGYGLINVPPLVETMPKDCLNPYSVTKCAAEDLCIMYNNLFGLKTITLRYFNVYGNRQPLKGQYAPVVGLFLKFYENNQPMPIVGTGKQKRDFTHVSDIVSGFEALGIGTHSAEIYQLGTGENYSINDLASFFGGRVEYIPSRPGEAWTTLADPAEMKKTTGWDAQTNIEMYVVDWLNKNA